MTSSTLHFAVIGDPIAHSRSPLMHNAAFRALGMNADYTAVHVTKDALPGFLERARREFNDISVGEDDIDDAGIDDFLDEEEDDFGDDFGSEDDFGSDDFEEE